MSGVTIDAGHDRDPFERVLGEVLPRPVYLTPEEVAGRWRELFPGIAASLPAPYPIFGGDEERIVTHGYPVLVSEGLQRLRQELDRVVSIETSARLEGDRRQPERDTVVQARLRYQRALTAVMENASLNDYGRGLPEVFLLFLSGDVARCLGQVGRLVQLSASATDRARTNQVRQEIGGVVADLIQRSAVAAVDGLKRLADSPLTPGLSPLLALVCQDQLLLTENRAPRDLGVLSGYLRHRYRIDPAALITALEGGVRRLKEHLQRQPQMAQLVWRAWGSRSALDHPSALLQPALLDVLADAELLDRLELSAALIEVIRELGTRLKALELITSLRRRVLLMTRQDDQLVLSGASSATRIAPSTRPFDFTTPGVVDSSVRRFGLVYDLSNFTALLEEVRKGGHRSEEKALQFMYVFQGRLEEIRRRRRLNFEKFLGDGAFYSSRRAHRVLAAACEIQQVYDQLRRAGFPFDRGIRLAINYGTYRLLPMLDRHLKRVHFEFFGHGVVELVRLTTGKSTREVQQIAEFLVHSGYDPGDVDRFLAPLLQVRAGAEVDVRRRYAAAIDGRGELVNEGIVVTLAFLAELEREQAIERALIARRDGLPWVLLPLDGEATTVSHAGLRLLGVARLKGLAPLELSEVEVWSQPPEDAVPARLERGLVGLLRELAANDSDPGEPAQVAIDERIVIVTYLELGGGRRWIFGEHRASDDVLVHSVEVPIRPPDFARDEPLEMWVLRNRYELAQMYESLRRETSGVAVPLDAVRAREDFTACFLAAPHRAPG